MKFEFSKELLLLNQNKYALNRLRWNSNLQCMPQSVKYFPPSVRRLTRGNRCACNPRPCTIIQSVWAQWEVFVTYNVAFIFNNNAMNINNCNIFSYIVFNYLTSQHFIACDLFVLFIIGSNAYLCVFFLLNMNILLSFFGKTIMTRIENESCGLL